MHMDIIRIAMSMNALSFQERLISVETKTVSNDDAVLFASDLNINSLFYVITLFVAVFKLIHFG